MSSSDSSTPDLAEARTHPRGLFAEWAVLALFFGTVLYLLHSGAVISGGAVNEQGARALASWHVGLTLQRLFPFALAIGAAASALALALLRRPVPAVLVCAALFAIAIAGWPLEDPRHIPDPSGRAGRIAWLECALAALVLAFFLVLACRRARLESNPGGTFSRAWVLLPVLFFAAAVPITSWTHLRRSPPMRAVRERVHEFLVGPPAWTVVHAPEKTPPYVGSLTPSLESQVDGGDLPALILPPASEVRFEIPLDAGPSRLRASAGVDRRFRWQLEHAPEETQVTFELEINGKPRFLAVVPARGPESSRAWHHAGGREGLEVAPGDVVTLKTSLSPPDAPVAGTLPLLAGFGRLELERTAQHPCVTASPETPNVVLIVMDTLRADELSCYGHAGGSSPHLDALAARGVLYEHACATSSWTWPSTSSILTGLAPEAHGVVDDDACFLDDGLVTVAEALEREDYVTAAFACNPLLDPVKNFDQGFETYDYSREFRKGDGVLPDIRAWIESHADTRFLLYLHFVDTHEPVAPEAQDLARVGVSATPPAGCPDRPTVEYRPALLRSEGLTPDGESNADLVVPPEHQRWIREMYSAEVSTADRSVGSVIDLVAKLGLEKKTIVAFTSDHGEELFDHGFLGHDHSLHQELVRVPLILAGPGIPRGIRTATPVSNANLAWTLARSGGGNLSTAEARIDLRAPDRIEKRKVFFSTEHGWWWNVNRITILGLEDWPWVLHSIPTGLAWGVAKGTDPGEGQFRLYDLENDPHERVDLSKQRPEIVEALRQVLSEHTRMSTAAKTGRSRGAGDATKAFLKRFGYAGEDEDPKKPH